MARILIGNIKGPQGAQGIQGPQGPVGATGPQGPMPDLINNALATASGVAALDAAMGKTLQDQITQLNSDLEDITGTSPSGTTGLHTPTKGTIGECWIWHNSTIDNNYGTVIGDYNPNTNTELIILNGQVTLRKTLADGTVTDKVIAIV